MLIDELQITLSAIAGLLCIVYIRRFDIHEQEPLGKMLLATVWGGVWSVVITQLLYLWLMLLGTGDPSSGLRPLLIIGPVEEAAKLLAFLSLYPFIRREMDEPADGLIYMACVALGFSVIENYFYTVHASAPGATFILRLLLCTPLHITFSAAMGLAFYNAIHHLAPWRSLLGWWLVASIAHGFYDLIVFNHIDLLLLLLVIMLLYENTMRLLSRAVALSPFRRPLAEFVASYENPRRERGLRCLNCGQQEDKLTYHLGRISFQKCDRCGGFATTKRSLYRIHQHFGSLVRRRIPGPGLFDRSKAELLSLSDGNFFERRGQLAFFDLESQNASLERMNQNVIHKNFRRPKPHAFWPTGQPGGFLIAVSSSTAPGTAGAVDPAAPEPDPGSGTSFSPPPMPAAADPVADLPDESS